MRKVSISRLRKNGFNCNFAVYLVAYTGIEPCWSAAATTASSQNDLGPDAIPKGFSYIHVTLRALRRWSRILAILLKFTDFTLSYVELVEELICAKSFEIRQSVDELFTIKKLTVPDAIFKNEYLFVIILSDNKLRLKKIQKLGSLLVPSFNRFGIAITEINSR